MRTYKLITVDLSTMKGKEVEATEQTIKSSTNRLLIERKRKIKIKGE